MQYDLAGRPVKTISPELTDGSQAVIETGYDANGNVLWVKDANGNTSTNAYDYRNRVVETIAPKVYDGSAYVADGTVALVHPVLSTIYDNVGNVTSVTDAEGNTTTNFYDAANRMFETWAPEVDVYGVGDMRPVTTNGFDKGGNIILTMDANEKTVRMQYDAFGRLTNTVDAIDNTIGFEYDENGNQTFLVDGNGNRTQFTYDGLNRKTSTIYPDTTHEDAEYDLLGNRVGRTDCNGADTEYYYDLRNRLYGVWYKGNDSGRQYGYDLAGNLTNVTEYGESWFIETNGCVSYAYDALNRVTNETSVGVTHTYAYDLNGNRTNAVYGVTGREVAWDYDKLNRIFTITENGNISGYLYDLNSKPVLRYYPTGVRELRTFDPMGRLLTMTTTNLTGSGSFDMVYSYDAVGSAREMVQDSWNLAGQATNAVTTWEYDDRYRLTNETVAVADTSSPVNRSTDYSWDSADNRLTKTLSIAGGSPAMTLYTNNALNQMTGWGDGTTIVDYQYDANGSRTNKSETVGGASSSVGYVYDEDNRLIAVNMDVPDHSACTTGDANIDCICDDCGEDLHDVSNGVCNKCALDIPDATHTFAYDYRSRRYHRSTPTETTYHVFDGGLSVQEYTVPPAPGGQPTVEFIRGEGMGGGVGGMVYSIRSGNIICSHANHRGDIIARSDSTGSLTSFALYEAYGTRPYEWGDDPDRQKANTKEEESDLNLLNEGMRYRDLATGTFLTRDPIGYADGPNVYCYVHCNPITKFDPFGLNTYLIIDITEPKTDTADWGHVLLGVTNYREVKNEDTGTVTMEPDGTITVYDLSGKYRELTMKTTELTESAAIHKSEVQAVIKFETGHETDTKVVDGLSKHKAENPQYDMKDNNCGDYAKAGLKAAGKDVDKIGYENTLLGRGITPNTLYKDAAKLPGAELMVDPGPKGDVSSVEALSTVLPDEAAFINDDDE